jgi:hypothetical protein
MKGLRWILFLQIMLVISGLFFLLLLIINISELDSILVLSGTYFALAGIFFLIDRLTAKKMPNSWLQKKLSVFRPVYVLYFFLIFMGPFPLAALIANIVTGPRPPSKGDVRLMQLTGVVAVVVAVDMVVMLIKEKKKKHGSFHVERIRGIKVIESSFLFMAFVGILLLVEPSNPGWPYVEVALSIAAICALLVTYFIDCGTKHKPYREYRWSYLVFLFCLPFLVLGLVGSVVCEIIDVEHSLSDFFLVIGCAVLMLVSFLVDVATRRSKDSEETPNPTNHLPVE